MTKNLILYNCSCFDEDIIHTIKNKHKPIVAFMNPPYSQTDDGGSELDFVYNMLNLLEPGGIGIAIIPINCDCSLLSRGVSRREAILKKHTLIGIMSMPTTLFYPVGIVTCVVIFRAHRKHDKNVKSWFAYYRDDGFIVSRNSGRIDRYKRWSDIKDKWVKAFKNREDIPSFSINVSVEANSEWCAEAYLQPNYDEIKEEEFKKAVEEYYVYKALYESKLNSEETEDEET